MKKSNRMLKLCLSLALTVGMVSGIGISAKAAFYANRTSTISGYSLVGILVVQETLHADGYSTVGSGQVTDLYLTTDRCWFPNNIANERTWKAAYPTGEYAKGSFNNVIGIPSPWGAVGLGTTTQVMSILF